MKLVQCSPFFNVLLDGPFKKVEKSENHYTSSIYLDMTKDELYPVLSLAIYGEGEINDMNGIGMIEVADYLGISSIVSQVETFYMNNLHAENVLDLFKFGRYYFFINLKTSALNYILNNFRLIKESESSGIHNLSEAELIEILSNHGLQCAEEDVWSIILDWSSANNTKPSLTLLKTVRFGRMDIQFFRREVALHPFIENTGLNEIINDFADLVTNLRNCENSVRTPSFAMPRDSQQYIFSFGGSDIESGVANPDVLVYKPGLDVWVNLEIQLPIPWEHIEGVYYNGSVYLCDSLARAYGLLGTNTVWKWDLKTLNVQEVCRIQETNQKFREITLCGEEMYVGGGKYEFSSNQWVNLPADNNKRDYAAIVSYCGQIFSLGGQYYYNYQSAIVYHSGPTNFCQVFDHKVNKWKRIPRMKACRSGAKAIVVGDKIYVVGGWDGFKDMKSCEAYIPKERRWTHIPDMTIPRNYPSLEFIDGKLFAIGGVNDRATASVEAYDFQAQKWTLMCKLPRKRLDMSSITVPAGVVNAELVRNIENKVQYLENKRIALSDDDSDEDHVVVILDHPLDGFWTSLLYKIEEEVVGFWESGFWTSLLYKIIEFICEIFQ